MFKKILEGNQYYWLVFHIVLGILAGINHAIVIGWLYFLILSTLLTLLSSKNHHDILHYFFSYYVTFEIFGRVLRLTPFIPVESGKYLAAFFLILGILVRCRNVKKYSLNLTGLAICILSIPSILLMREEDFLNSLVFNWLGIFDLGLFVIYFSNYVFSRKEVINILQLIVYPLVSMSVYLLFNTPSLDKLNFNIGANSAASGHFGPNQVSSVFGTGIFILGTALILGYRIFKKYYLDVIALMLFLLRGLLTFSRGGMFSAMLALVVIFLLGRAGTFSQSIKKIGVVLVLGVIIYFLFNYINGISGNNLLGRYEGETYETQGGGKEKNLETVTDGRSLIINAEISIFLQHPLLGVGPGQSDQYWDIGDFVGAEKLASHTEFSRLLAEHGLPGLIICILLIYPLGKFWVNRRSLLKRNYAYYLNIAFLIFAISMSTHSAMRTMITPFFFGLAFAGMRTLGNVTPKPSEKSEEEMDLVVS